MPKWCNFSLNGEGHSSVQRIRRLDLAFLCQYRAPMSPLFTARRTSFKMCFHLAFLPLIQTIQHAIDNFHFIHMFRQRETLLSNYANHCLSFLYFLKLFNPYRTFDLIVPSGLFNVRANSVCVLFSKYAPYMTSRCFSGRCANASNNTFFSNDF